MKTKSTDVRVIDRTETRREKSGPIGPVTPGKRTCFSASIPYVSGLIFAMKRSISGRSFTGYIAPERKNIGMTIKFIITLKLS